MTNKGTYRINRQGNTICRHGALLHGTNCVACEREAGTEDGRQTQEAWAMQYDAVRGPGPDPRHAADAFAYAFHRWEHVNDPRVRPEHWGAPPHRKAVEIITDPDDPRGINARRVHPISRSATL